MVSGAARIVTRARTEKAPKPVCDPHRGVGSGCSKEALALSASWLIEGMGMGLNGERDNKVGERKSERHGGRDALTKEMGLESDDDTETNNNMNLNSWRLDHLRVAALL